MKCPSCNKKFNVNNVAAVAFSKSYDCPGCRSKLIKNSNTSWVIWGGVLAAASATGQLLSYMRFETPTTVIATLSMGLAAGLALEYFFQDLNLSD